MRGVVAIAVLAASGCVGDSTVGQDASTDSTQPDVTQADASDGGLTGIATFEIHCDSKLLVTRNCPTKRWEFDFTGCDTSGTTGDGGTTGDAGVHKIELLNTGTTYPVAWMIRNGWALGGKYVPGVQNDGQDGEMHGVLAPGQIVDISSVFMPGGPLFALVGSVRPFATGADTAPKGDEGTIPWSNGALGAFNPTSIFVAQPTRESGTTTCGQYGVFF
jgi:hypothetical protein